MIMIHKIQLSEKNKKRILYSLPWFVQEFLVQEPLMILAGGRLASALNGTKSEDYDFFYLGSDPWDDVIKRIRSLNVLNYCSMAPTQHNCATFTHPSWHPDGKNSLKIQVIRMEGVTTPEGILDNFDLVPCMIAMDINNLWTDKITLKAIFKKEIKFHKVGFPIVAMKRFLKYHDKGYKVDDAAIQEFLEQIHTRLLTYNLVDANVTRESLWRSYLHDDVV
jgi:hypothetical protein